MKDIPLKQIKRKEEEERTKEKARKLNLPYVDLSLKPINVEDVVTIPEKKARAAKLACVSKVGRKVIIALNDPHLPQVEEVLGQLKKKGFKIKKVVASESSLQKAWGLYQQWTPEEPSLKDVLPIKEENLSQVEKIKNLNQLGETIKTASTTELLQMVISGGIKARASDIHFEPQKNKVRLRYRIDGVLQTIGSLSKEGYHWLLSRVKILAGLKLNIHDINQDGRFSVQIQKEKKKTPVRVSVVPGEYGESIVMRLLGIGIQKLGMEELGIREATRQKLEAELSKPNGIILSTGPTGSGKTTTLYAFLKKLNQPGVKIITIEDPIEYNLEGINQSQVEPEKGYTFKKALEAVLRQNPDIILVGEMRNPESAKTALQAALTGHLVFSTLHTNDAAGAVARLRQLEVEQKLIPSAVNAVIGQRLVRKLCPHCKKKRPLSEEEKANIKKALSLISPKSGIEPPKIPQAVYQPQGCPQCMGLGYKGRTGIFEVFTINDVIEKLILEQASTYDIRAKAMEEGMLTMLQDGILKVLEGTTSLEEISRVAGEAKYIESLYGRAISSLLSRTLVVKEKVSKAVSQLALDFEKIEEKLKRIEVKELSEWIAAAALNLRATDIHIEPQEENFLIRFRIDGVLETIATLPKGLFLSVLSEIKELSGLKPGVHKKVQEGRFKIKSGAKTLDTRVSIIPGGYGETAVIRLLRPDIQKVPLEELGIRPFYKKRFARELAKPNGIIFATGPTSSGKTTTLYAVMSKLNKPGVKIITIEDPIEYSLKGIIQTQINEEEGYTFAQALKSVLRQNPNIIMIGEVRDPETAQTAIRASLTGHLVLSTLHTNDAPSSFQRLINLGVDPKDIASSCNMIIAQRLVRKLCPACRKKKELTPKQVEKIKSDLEGIPGSLKPDFNHLILYQAQGCEKCGPSGYKGMTGLFEILFVTEEIKNLIVTSPSTEQIKKAALKSGMLTIRQDGLLKALEGITTLEEVERVS